MNEKIIGCNVKIINAHEFIFSHFLLPLRSSEILFVGAGTGAGVNAIAIQCRVGFILIDLNGVEWIKEKRLILDLIKAIDFIIFSQTDNSSNHSAFYMP